MTHISEHDTGFRLGWELAARRAIDMVENHIQRLEPGKNAKVRAALCDAIASIESVLLAQQGYSVKPLAAARGEG